MERSEGNQLRNRQTASACLSSLHVWGSQEADNGATCGDALSIAGQNDCTEPLTVLHTRLMPAAGGGQQWEDRGFAPGERIQFELNTEAGQQFGGSTRWQLQAQLGARALTLEVTAERKAEGARGESSLASAH